jgi:cyclopropane fatty-acyl-phospholipid synthase-like methyltransferase
MGKQKKAPFRWGWNHTKKLQEILPVVKKGLALDIGCGCGGNSIFLARKGFRVVALDKRQEMIDCLKKRIKSRRLKSLITARRINLAHSLWPKKKYSLILALNILHFLTRQRALLLIREMKVSLLPEGVVFIQIFSHKNRPKGKGYHPSPAAMRKLFRDFKILDIRHYRVKENHPPLGLHTHWVLDLIAKKVK